MWQNQYHTETDGAGQNDRTLSADKDTITWRELIEATLGAFSSRCTSCAVGQTEFSRLESCRFDLSTARGAGRCDLLREQVWRSRRSREGSLPSSENFHGERWP